MTASSVNAANSAASDLDLDIHRISSRAFSFRGSVLVRVPMTLAYGVDKESEDSIYPSKERAFWHLAISGQLGQPRARNMMFGKCHSPKPLAPMQANTSTVLDTTPMVAEARGCVSLLSSHDVQGHLMRLGCHTTRDYSSLMSYVPLAHQRTLRTISMARNSPRIANQRPTCEVCDLQAKVDTRHRCHMTCVTSRPFRCVFLLSSFQPSFAF